MRFFPFADPSHKLRASAQGQNDKIHNGVLGNEMREGSSLSPQNDKKEDF